MPSASRNGLPNPKHVSSSSKIERGPAVTQGMRLLFLATTALVPLGSGAFAQETSAPSVGPERTASAVGAATEAGGEIIVTAQKRAQRLIDVPLSISAVSGQSLDDQHIQSLDELAGRVAGFNVESSQPGNTRLVLRGLDTGGANSTTAVYVDETPYGSSTGLANGATLSLDLDTYDLDRIEVLRGPQGTLYGASSLGGVIKFVTNAPSTKSFDASVEGTFESVDGGNDGWTSKGMVNVPLTQDVAIRATGFYRRDSGYVDDPTHNEKNVNDGHTYGGRVSLLDHVTPYLTVQLTAALENLNSNSTPEEDVDALTLKPIDGRLDQDRGAQPFSDVRYRVYSALVKWDLGFANLLSNTSYGSLDQRRSQDASFAVGFAAPVGIFSQIKQHRTAEELRLTSAGTSKFDWQIGGYYDRERSDLFENEGLIDPANRRDISTSLVTVALPSFYRELAAFANLTYHFNHIFDISVGGRFSDNHQHALESLNGTPGPRIGTSDQVYTYSVAPEAHITSDLTAYGRVAKGYRPGGPNVVPPGSPIAPTYGPDTVTSYEVGLKGDLLQHRLTFEIAGFWIDWHNIQLLTAVNGFNVNANSGTARSRGVEASTALTPVTGLTLSGNVSYTQAKLRNNAPLLSAFAGDRLPFSPKWSGAATADYELPITENLKAFVGASFRHIGQRSSEFFGGFGHAELPSYNSVDLRAGLREAKWSLEAFVLNVGNSHGLESFNQPGTSPGAANGLGTGVSVIQPRTVGVTVGLHY